MLCNEIAYNRIYEMSLKGETFTPAQSAYLNKITELSNGTFVTLCKQVKALNVESKASYDFVMVVRTLFKNFVANQLIDNGIHYSDYCVAWNAFADAMPEVEEQHILNSDFVELKTSDTDKTFFAIVFTKFPNPDFAGNSVSDEEMAELEAHALSISQDERNQDAIISVKQAFEKLEEQGGFDFTDVLYAVQLPRETASKLQSAVHTYNCQNVAYLSDSMALNTHW
ncbi:hypothetical protein [Vibrio vulnificus]|uniref:Uncharacterized protein n=1 Tax=Vibrio vulnificus TaxID=672 RepID=A0AAN1UFZ0_VIBVL|nr:hypothetical protein [Vibrio vulnificus]AXX63968.1 hypothetical protein FORC53_5629 [Vibrio vulnificus]